jgi:hypothetical protein
MNSPGCSGSGAACQWLGLRERFTMNYDRTIAALAEYDAAAVHGRSENGAGDRSRGTRRPGHPGARRVILLRSGKHMTKQVTVTVLSNLACECGGFDPDQCSCYGVKLDVRCVWASDGSVTMTDQRTMQKYLALYGLPAQFRFEVLGSG